jgi:malonyl-CoA/methylmalonyl-CoA synthetase
MVGMFTARVAAHAEDGARLAIVDPAGSWTYADLAGDAERLARALQAGAGAGVDDLAEARVALLCTPGHDFVIGVLGTWMAGGIAVPLHPAHPDAELDHVLTDAGIATILASPVHGEQAHRLATHHGATVTAVPAPVPAPTIAGDAASTTTDTTGPAAGTGAPTAGDERPKEPAAALPEVGRERRAMIVYTSGTTGRPKGAVHTHRSLAAMAEGMAGAWRWSPDDRILLVLPLHHVHGIVNVTLCPLWVGAVCEAPSGFDAAATWDRLASGELTLLMAVPTVYRRLITAWDEADAARRAAWSAGAAKTRLMVSGSAALPVSTLERWTEITGHVLLERYGMTELGMVLSNTLDHRAPGHVGEPMPGVELRLVDDDGADLDPAGDEPGELLVRGPQVFAGYWGRPDATAAAFVDGWFRTGDVAVHDPDGYRLLGRSSVDIIKTGGEKVSALEIEEVYRTHPDVADAAVVGVADPDWGERVCMALVLRPGARADGDLRAWGKERMAAYKVPSRFVVVDELPRNALGKVVKADVVPLFD